MNLSQIESQPLASFYFTTSGKNMTTTNNDLNKSIGRLTTKLEQIQGHLLMIKAANLAYNHCFNEGCPDSYSRSPYSPDETAQYFICQFLELEPEAIIEQAIDAIYELKSQLDRESSQPINTKSSEATINISIGRD